MIKYSLRCARDHTFEGWFQDSAGFDSQLESGALSCPVCGDMKIGKALMAPRLNFNRAAVGPLLDRTEPSPQTPDSQPTAEARLPATAAESQTEAAAHQGAAKPAPKPAAEPTPEQIRAFLRTLRRQVEMSCVYVGDKLAEEARLLHEGESGHDGIYGHADPEEIEELSEDGIDLVSIPWLPLEDA